MSSLLLQSTLFLLIPLFSVALIVLALSHSPGPHSPQAILAYTYIAAVTVLSTLAGALSLSHSSKESLVQALLFLFIGIPVLHLAPTYVPHLSTRKLHTSILVITLSIATLLALISPFLPTATPLLYIPPSLFLLYTIQSIPRIAYILHHFLHPEDSIQIPVQFHPNILPSPASTASFPDEIHQIRKHHHKIPSLSTTSTITIVDRTRISFPPRPQQEQQPNDQLRSQILSSRSRSLLVFILAVQIAALAASACALAVTISPTTTLKTVQTACTVLAVTGSMSAYLLHTYNLHLRQSPTPSNYNNFSPNQLDHSHSPMLIQLTPPASRKPTNAGVSMEKNQVTRNDETKGKAVPTLDSDLEELELELDVVMDIGSYSMTLGGPATTTEGKKRTVVQDSIDLGLALVSTCTPVPAALPVPVPLRVSVEEGSGVTALRNKEKQKEREKEIQGYYLSSSSSVSTGSPSSPFERRGMETETETDPSSPDTPYLSSHLHPNTSGASPGACSGDGNTNTIAFTHTPIRKRSSFFGWEFAWDQEALERADNAGKLRSAAAAGGSPVRWKSDVHDNAKLKETLNPSTSDHAYTSKKIQPLLTVDHEDSGDQESFGPSPSLSRPHSLSSEADVRGGMKRGMSWRSSVCGVVGVGGEKVKRKNTLGLGIGMKPLRLSRSFGGTSGGGGRGSRSGAGGTGNGREMGHRTIFSGDVGSMCGLSLKRKTTALVGGQRSPVSPVSGSAVSSRVMSQGNGDATRTATTTSKRLKKKTKPGLSAAAAGTSPSAESEMGESKSNIDNHSAEFTHDDNRNLDWDDDHELDEDADLQKTPTMKSRNTTRSYSHSPQSYHYSPSSSPNQQQQRQEAATSESHCTSINESCVTITTTATTNTNSPPNLSPSLTRRGLSLKRSFKMGSTIGRTLGPGLTLSSAGLSSVPGAGSGSGPLTSTSTCAWQCAHKLIRRCESEGFGFREEDEQREKEKHIVCENLDDDEKVQKLEKDGKIGKEEDEDVNVEAEMRSLVTARVVSASYARATPAATILTPPTRVGFGVDIDGNGDGGLASRSGGSDSPGPVKYTNLLHSRPSLPIMTSSSTLTQQYQQQHRYQHQQDGYNSAFSATISRGYNNGHAWKPQPAVDWFRPSEELTSRGDDDDDDVSVEQEMGNIGGLSRGNDDDRLSPLPLLPLPPPLLLPPITPSQSQSQSLPATPTKSRSTLLGKPSMSNFKKRSAPPVLAPPSGSSEWALLRTNGVGVGGATVSMVSLAHSQSVVGPGQGQGSRPTTPRPGMRMSAMNMGTVRSAFAGMGAKVSARMSINGGSTRGGAGVAAGNAVASSMGMGVDDIDGDFMDLRDPFASPPPFKLANVFKGGDHGGGDFWVSERDMSSLGGAGLAGYDDDDGMEVEIGRRMSGISGKRRVNMNAWGQLPIPDNSALTGSAPEMSSGSASSLVAGRKKAHSHHGERRKHKKDKRGRNAVAGAVVGNGVLGETNSSLHGYGAPSLGYNNAGEEDVDFDVEEALLSQRLLRRLDSVEWD